MMLNTNRSNHQDANNDKLVHLIDEQAIMQETFRLCFATEPDQELVGFTGDATIESLDSTVSELMPDVVVMGVDIVRRSTVEKLEMIRERNPEAAIILLSDHYDEEGMEALREFSLGASAGYAYLLMDAIETQEQLAKLTSMASQGSVIIDPIIMAGLIGHPESNSTSLTETIAWESPPWKRDSQLWMGRN